MKTMLVTGASSGVGRALAIRAARAGYAVYAIGRDVAALDAVRAKVESEGGFISIDATDISIAENARGIIERALARFGSLDVLVNNAGFVSAGPLVAQSNSELERQFGTHVIGPVALVREAFAALCAARGHVLMLGSGVARVPIGGLGAYPPAKAAIRSATSILRRELQPHGVAVTYVDPGAIDTPFMKRAGMPGAPGLMLVSPEAVARKILIAIAKRPRILNIVRWQTAAVALAERFPRLTDIMLDRAPGLTGGNVVKGRSDAPTTPLLSGDALAATSRAQPPVPLSNVTGAQSVLETDRSTIDAVHPAPALLLPNDGRVSVGEPESAASDSLSDRGFTPFESALEPHRRRMEKLNFRESFVRDLLVPATTLDLGEVALRWAGMPNKNERAITADVFEALADAGFLERSIDHAYLVLRAP